MPDHAAFDPTDEQIAALAEDIRHIEARHEVAAMVAVGYRILADLFHGDFEAFQSRSSRKGNSLERLARATGRTPETLGWRVKVARQYPRYDGPFRDQVTFSHHVELLGAPEIERNQLCRQAAMQSLTVRQLHRLIHPDEKIEPTTPISRARRLLDAREAFQSEAERAAREPEKAATLIKDWEEVAAMARAMIKTARTKPKSPRKKNSARNGK